MREFISFILACIEESISEREDRQFEEGLNSKVGQEGLKHKA